MLGREALIAELCDHNSGFAVTPIIDADNQIGDASIDLRLGPDLIVTRRETGVAVFDPADVDTIRERIGEYQAYVRRPFGSAFYLHPGQLALARSLEYVTLPGTLGAEAMGRSSWGRLGLIVATATMIHPGFTGTITLELVNVGNVPIVLYVGTRIAQLAVHSVFPSSVQQDGERVIGGRQAEHDPQKDPATSRVPEPGRYFRQFRPRFSAIHRDRDLLWVVPFPVDLIVAIVGYRFAGKSTVLNYLSERRGYRVYTLGNELREMARERGIAIEPRRSLQDFGDEFRAEAEDAGRLARGLLGRMRHEHLATSPDVAPRVAVAGFRRPEELEVMLAVERVEVIALEADDQIRFDRGLRNGVLDRELTQIEQHTDQKIDRSFQAFCDYVDLRDRTGTDPQDEPSPWTQGYAQANDEVAACARGYIERTGRGTAITNNFNEVAELYREIDGALHEMEKRRRLRVDLASHLEFDSEE